MKQHYLESVRIWSFSGLYSVQMRENTDQKNFKYGHFLPSASLPLIQRIWTLLQTHLSCLEERLLDIETPSRRYENLIKQERNAFYNLKDNTNIIKKGTDKGSVTVVCDTQEYFIKLYKQLKDKEVHEQVANDTSVLINIIMKVF